MEVTDRVHIAAHGWEVARLVEPLFELKADKLVLVLPMDDAYLADFEHEMIADLESMERLEVELRRANSYDLDSSVQAFTRAVKDHEGDDVYINISTGTNVAAIAGMMAAQTSDATPYYVTPTLTDEEDIEEDEEVWTPEEPIFTQAGEISELPVFELQGPSSEQLQIMGFLLDKDGVTKKELIRFAEDKELPFIANTEAKSDEGRYRLLESHIIDPLTDGGYVRVEKAGRTKNVFLEQRGIDALAAFPLDDDTIETVESGVDSPQKFLEKWKNQSRYDATSVNPRAEDSQWQPFADSQYDSDDEE
jgi:hypothetical protein